MELIVEFDPPRNKRSLEEGARRLAGVYDWLDIPDAPLGKPNYNSPVISAYLAALGFRVVAHLRVQDYNVVSFKNITKTLGSLGVERMVFLRGDPPQQGAPVDQVTPEEAVAYALRRPEAPEPGLLISLKKSLEEISARLGAGARFYYVLNYDWKGELNGKLDNVIERARERGARIYVYLIIPRDGVPGAEVMRQLPNIDGIIVSWPRAPVEDLVRLGKNIREWIS